MKTREHFDAELSELQSQLRELGTMTANAVSCALEVIGGDDRERCMSIAADDKQIDRAQQRLDAHAVDLIALQQPVARDLRRILAAIAIGSELERIADYAKGIAKYAAGPEGAPPLDPPASLLELGQASREMLRLALDAVERSDPATARSAADADDTTDMLYKRTRAELVERLSSAPELAARTADLLFVAHNLERIGDRATNVAERVIYLASGDVVELNP
jgi:phosphate transport system protein